MLIGGGISEKNNNVYSKDGLNINMSCYGKNIFRCGKKWNGKKHIV